MAGIGHGQGLRAVRHKIASENRRTLSACKRRRIKAKCFRKRRIEKHLLCLSHGDTMLLVFSLVTGIPLEASDLGKVKHFCILPSHTFLLSSLSKCRAPERAPRAG